MKKILTMAAVGLLGFSIAGCTQDERRVAGYGAGGAAIGALAGGALTGRTRGAVAGAAIGAVAGTMVGVAQTRNGVRYCNYRDRRGRIYQAPCR